MTRMKRRPLLIVANVRLTPTGYVLLGANEGEELPLTGEQMYVLVNAAGLDLPSGLIGGTVSIAWEPKKP